MQIMLIISLNMHFTGSETIELIEFYGKSYIRFNLGTFETPCHKILTGLLQMLLPIKDVTTVTIGTKSTDVTSCWFFDSFDIKFNVLMSCNYD